MNTKERIKKECDEAVLGVDSIVERLDGELSKEEFERVIMDVEILLEHFQDRLHGILKELIGGNKVAREQVVREYVPKDLNCQIREDIYERHEWIPTEDGGHIRNGFFHGEIDESRDEYNTRLEDIYGNFIAYVNSIDLDWILTEGGKPCQ